jgi:heparan-alpha-glucosaminide N-acetyltransferase
MCVRTNLILMAFFVNLSTPKTLSSKIHESYDANSCSLYSSHRLPSGSMLTNPSMEGNPRTEMKKELTSERILSIDALRGITILTMIFVNELAGVSDIPGWMKHMSADADAMTFVDVVFPAFLFIVGMSIPFALANRIAKGEHGLKLQLHILFRTLGLLVLGVFMVNAEGGYNEEAMGMSIHLWSLLFLICAVMVWNVYSFKNHAITYVLRGVGIVGLLVLAIMFRGGDDGTETMKPQWWGILGLIGWAYLIGCSIYQLVKGKVIALLTAIVVCVVYFALGKSTTASNVHWIFSQGGHAIHAALVLCGIVLSLIFFDQSNGATISKRFAYSFGFTVALIIAGVVLRPYYTISKIWATPTWALYSAAICCVLFSFLYWLIDLKHVSRWTKFFKPAASNPLLTYIIPYFVYASMHLLGLSWPDIFYQGVYGMIWSLVFAIAVMSVVVLLNKMKIKLQL